MGEPQKKWTSSAGPRQTKEVNTALTKMRQKGQEFVEIRGVIGGEETRSGYWSPCEPTSPECIAAMNEIAEKYDYTVTRENYRDIIADVVAATNKLKPREKDCRLTPEKDAEKKAILEAARRKQDEDDAARKAEIDRSFPCTILGVPLDGPHISRVTTAKLIRRALARHFPGSTFSVRKDATSIRVTWTDGPSKSEVNGIVGGYEGRGFDGMIDLAYYIQSWVMPDGSAEHAESRGTEGSAGVDPAFKNDRPHPDAVKVSTGVYVSLSRTLSENAEAKLRAAFKAEKGYEPDEQHDRMTFGDFRRDFSLYQKPTTTPPASRARADGDEEPTIQSHYHTKKQRQMALIVWPRNWLTDESFRELRRLCTAAGGWYSRAWGGTPGGFAWWENDRAACEAFFAEHFAGAIV